MPTGARSCGRQAIRYRREGAVQYGVAGGRTRRSLRALFVVPSDPEATFRMMLLAREDVQVGRTGVWRPKETVRPLLSSIVAIPLNGGWKGGVDLRERQPTKAQDAKLA